jgi:3-oxoacyl-[acyl-carrier-protein] synthase-3
MVSGIVAVVPPLKRSLMDDVDRFYGGDVLQVERISRSIGLHTRHIVDNETTTADLCEHAANLLMGSLGVNKSSIDAIILVTQTPDYFQPATACYLHGVLDLSEHCAAFDVNQGCTGYIYGLWLAHMMVESGGCSNVLLLAGDTMSKVVNPSDSNVAPLFGDAGTATLIQGTEKASPSYFSLHTNGKKFSTIIQPEGAFRKPSIKQIKDPRVFQTSDKRALNELFMDGAEVFNFSIQTEPKAIKEILEFSGKNQDDIDYIIFHQANKYIISNIARRLKFPIEKAPCETTGRYGNQSSASIPTTICDALSNKASSSKIDLILSGFGVGLSWGSCNIVIDNIFCPEVYILPQEIDQRESGL